MLFSKSATKKRLAVIRQMKIVAEQKTTILSEFKMKKGADDSDLPTLSVVVVGMIIMNMYTR